METSSLFENCNILRCQKLIWDNFNFLHQNWIEKFMFWWFFGKSLRLFLVPEDKIPCYKTTLLKEGACIPFRYRYVHCIADIYARAPFLALKWPFIEQHDIDNNIGWDSSMFMNPWKFGQKYIFTIYTVSGFQDFIPMKIRLKWWGGIDGT